MSRYLSFHSQHEGDCPNLGLETKVRVRCEVQDDDNEQQ